MTSDVPRRSVQWLSAIHALALTIWSATLISAAIAAMNVFPTMKVMAIDAERFDALPRDEHGLIVAGVVMERIFATIDIVQMAIAPIAVLTGIIVFYRSRACPRPWSARLHVVAIVLAGVLLAGHLTMLAPTMNRELHAFWSSAEAGDVEDAREHRAAFDELHPFADTLLRANLFILLAAGGCFAFAAAGPHQDSASCRL
ncbi:MAG: hypothetical protein KC983_05660 [Phycisphaerales bacterium]|nr:hypothetical protein [Phycisphaerales bacterium]